jgi:hypothetical protein
MISSYPNALYEHKLTDWHVRKFSGTSHTGSREECIWTNYRPHLMHDTRFLGWTFQGRQMWRRKQARWVSRFARMSRAEQQAMMRSLQTVFSYQEAERIGQ